MRESHLPYPFQAPLFHSGEKPHSLPVTLTTIRAMSRTAAVILVSLIVGKIEMATTLLFIKRGPCHSNVDLLLFVLAAISVLVLAVRFPTSQTQWNWLAQHGT